MPVRKKKRNVVLFPSAFSSEISTTKQILMFKFHSGALCVVSVSWYAADIIYDFSLSEHDNDIFVYEFGSALYVGWVASVSWLLLESNQRLSVAWTGFYEGREPLLFSKLM